jgi:CHASE2 domain-containing sensor protein
LIQAGALGFVHGNDAKSAVTIKAVTEHKLFRPGVGVAAAIIVGWVLWATAFGENWIDASYDYSFRFGTRTITNKIVLVLMDNEAYAQLGQTRGQPWDRALHARLLNKLADDGCPLVVFDVFFAKPGKPEGDQALAAAMHRLKRVALAAQQSNVSLPGALATHPILPTEPFLSAANANWGVAYLEPDFDLTVRRHWPFPSPGQFPSLPWRAARLDGATLNSRPQKRWLRYYAFNAFDSLSYDLALGKPPGYFRDKIVFIGNQPETYLPDREEDKFRTPFTSWTGAAVGGMEIMATSFLNLINGDWLRRPNGPWEGLIFALFGAALGVSLTWFRPLAALGLALGAAISITLGGILLSYFTNYWFPWLIVAGGQIPAAFACALIPAKVSLKKVQPDPNKTIVLSFPEQKPPDVPEYELFEPPFGRGAFGKVWLARNAIGQWQALKAVYQANFGTDARPYDAEFKGIQKYKPISEKHPGLLRVELVSKKKTEGYFYYVMELGDALTPGWEQNPAIYKPRDLESMRKQAEDRRLSVLECARIGVALADALDYLHRQGLTHRDIKPSNVIFVSDQPKLADVGLVTDIRPTEQVNTIVGTLGYMPPPPERPGTAQADIYALGMLLYVISSGRDPGFFPELSTSLMERSGHADFIRLDAIILKACQPDVTQRYQTTGEMLRELQETAKALGLKKSGNDS